MITIFEKLKKKKTKRKQKLWDNVAPLNLERLLAISFFGICNLLRNTGFKRCRFCVGPVIIPNVIYTFVIDCLFLENSWFCDANALLHYKWYRRSFLAKPRIP